MSVIVVATIRPLPEHRDAVIAACEQSIPKVHAEEGCELYALHQNKNLLVMVEKWASPELLRAHGAGDALKELHEAQEGKIDGEIDVQILQACPIGDAALGAL